MSAPSGGTALANPRDTAAMAEARALEKLPEAQGFTLFRTSGSTDRPKWVALTDAALEASAEAVNRHLETTPRDCWLRVLPLFHVGGYAIPLRARLGGCRLVEDDGKWEPARFCDLCEGESVTLSSLVPTQVHDLIEAGLRAPRGLRAIVVGGGDLRPAVWRQAREMGWPLLTSYGLSEAASQVATMGLNAGDDPTALTLLPHWETRLDAEGILQIRGPALFTAYFMAKIDGSWQIERPGDWFTTQDRVELDGCSMRFLGRRDAVVKILGELVDFAAIERRLADLSAGTSTRGLVRMVAVPDERAGHRIVLESAASEAETATLLTALNAQLPPYAVVREVRRVTAIARSPLGKPLAQRPPAPTDPSSS